MSTKVPAQKILEKQQLGLLEFKRLKGKAVKIKTFDIKDGKCEFILETEYGEQYPYDIQTSKLDEFLDEFTVPAIKALESSKTGNSLPSTISDIRTILFDTLQKVHAGKMDTTQAKTVSDVAQTLLNSARIEMQYKKDFEKK